MRIIFIAVCCMMINFLQAQLTPAHYQNYELLELNLSYGFYYKMQAPTTPKATKSLPQYPLQILLENRSSAAIKNKIFYLIVLKDGEQVVIELPPILLAASTARTHTIMIEARQHPIVISGHAKNKEE